MKQSETLGTAVSKKLKERGWTLRQASIRTHVSHNTIGDMAQGIIPGRGMVIQWAEGLNESVNDWLVLAGYDPIPTELCLPAGTPPEVREEIMLLLKKIGNA